MDSLTSRGYGIQVNPGNVEEILTAIGCGYTAYDPAMIACHEEYCPKCRAKRAES